MVKIFLILVVGIFCSGCASSQARAATPVKMASVEKLNSGNIMGGCRMMPNGYMVCPKQ